MIGQTLAGLMIVLALAGPDPAALVVQLGSDRPGEREAAVRALEELGGKALAPLRAACTDQNPDIRARAAELWTTITQRLMVEPTMVTLDLDRRSPEQAIAAIQNQSGLALGFIQEPPQRAITLREPAPLAFWQAVDRLGYAIFQFQFDNPAGQDVKLVFDARRDRGPVASSGPFQVELTALRDHRARSFAGFPWVKVDESNQRISVRQADKESMSRFYADLLVRVEPRMRFFQEAPPQATEAVDDLGQSLVPDAVDDTLYPFHAYHGEHQHGMELGLRMPAHPGRTIQRLVGTVPLIIEMRRPEPALIVPLAGAAGKTFATSDITITELRVTEDARATHIHTRFHLNLDRADLPGHHRGQAVSTRLGDVLNNQTEITDASGKVLSHDGGGSWSQENRAQQHFAIPKGPGAAPPAQLRYYSMLRVRHALTFRFDNIPMP
jgi:hypothetical protein